MTGAAKSTVAWERSQWVRKYVAANVNVHIPEVTYALVAAYNAGRRSRRQIWSDAEFKRCDAELECRLRYTIQLQRVIEAYCREEKPLPYPELYHSRTLTSFRQKQETKARKFS